MSNTNVHNIGITNPILPKIPPPLVHPTKKYSRFSGFIIIKLKDNEIFYNPEKSLYSFIQELNHKNLLSIFKQYPPKSVRRQIESIDAHELRILEQKAKKSIFPPLRSLAAYWRLDYREQEGSLDFFIEQLNALDEIEFAYKELKTQDPSNGDYTHKQFYLKKAIEGIDAQWMWEYHKVEGKGVGFIDLEAGWIWEPNGKHNHEDLPNDKIELIAIERIQENLHGKIYKGKIYRGDHGIKTLGVVVAVKNNKGINGIAHGVDYIKLISSYRDKDRTSSYNRESDHPPLHVADSILKIISLLDEGSVNRGDILLLEVQRDYLPTEMDPADFDAIRLASNDLIVIEAAGNGGDRIEGEDNGGYDLDGQINSIELYAFRRGGSDFQDSGAIMVGAANFSEDYSRRYSSNFGSRIDCFAHGQEVVTTGGLKDKERGTSNIPDHGDQEEDGDKSSARDNYWSSYTGTSAASAVIAGAAILLQSLHKKENSGQPISSLQLRSLLSDIKTGTQIGVENEKIGVMPNLKKIVKKLRYAPNIYIRDNIYDNGGYRRDNYQLVNKSPDIIIRNSRVEDSEAEFGERSGRKDSDDLSDEVKANQDNYIYVRVKNKSNALAKDVKVKVYWRKPHTLITPELWKSIQTNTNSENNISINVPEGNIIAINNNPIVWKQRDIPDTGKYSFIAILSYPSDEFDSSSVSLALDNPEIRNFSWSNFREYVRRSNNIVLKNYHVIHVNSTSHTIELPFTINGTSDEERIFDLQIIRDLPENTKVILRVPYGFYRTNNLSDIGDEIELTDNHANIELPFSNTTICLCDIPLFREKYTCKLIIEVTNELMRDNFNVYINQIHENKEVGRITWALRPESTS